MTGRAVNRRDRIINSGGLVVSRGSWIVIMSDRSVNWNGNHIKQTGSDMNQNALHCEMSRERV